MSLNDAPRPIGIHGAPRSGTSWLGQIFNSHPSVAYRYQPLFSYAFRDRIGRSSSADEFHSFFDDLLRTDDDFVLQIGKARMSASTLEFSKDASPSHLVYKEVRFHNVIEPLLAAVPGFKGIGIVRDPRAVLSSWFSAPREFKQEWDPLQEWRSGRSKNAGLEENWYGFDRWIELANLFLDLSRRFPRRFFIVRYEDLRDHTQAEISRMFRNCDLEVPSSTTDFIRRSTTMDDQDPYGVFRNHSAGSSAFSLPESIGKRVVDELRGSPLENFLSDP